MTFGERLMKLRRERGLSQEALGDMVDVTRQTVSKWERSESTPELEKLMELARIFESPSTGSPAWSMTRAQSSPRPSLRRVPTGAGTMSTRAAAAFSACRSCT